MNDLTLNNLDVGQKVEIVKVNNKNSIGRRLLDMGIVPGSKIECVMKSPGGNPIAYLVKGAVIAIRKEDTSNIIVKRIEGEISD